MLELNKIYCMDCIEGMKLLDENSIDLTVTSPPYDNLRTYNNSSQWNFDIFKHIAEGLYRVTKQGGVVVWVVGDATINGSETGTSFRQALYFKEIGFNLHDTMIYQKVSYMPLNHNRYDPEFEYMFVFSKEKPKTFNPLKEPCAYVGATYNYATRTSATTEDPKSAKRKRDKIHITNAEKYRGNIWPYDVGKNKGSKDNIWEHPATFPEKLAKDHILSWSNEGDLVLDPFMGSGTTAKMAYLARRNYIGFEIDKEYHKLATERLEEVKNQLTLGEAIE